MKHTSNINNESIFPGHEIDLVWRTITEIRVLSVSQSDMGIVLVAKCHLLVTIQHTDKVRWPIS